MSLKFCFYPYKMRHAFEELDFGSRERSFASPHRQMSLPPSQTLKPVFTGSIRNGDEVEAILRGQGIEFRSVWDLRSHTTEISVTAEVVAEAREWITRLRLPKEKKVILDSSSWEY